MRTTPLTAVLAAAAAAALGGLTACGGSKGATTTTPGPPPPRTVTNAAQDGKPVTPAQAIVLGRLLLRNHDDGGAHVTGDFPFSTTARVLVDGEIDWRHLRGTMTVREPTQPVAAARRYVWTQKTVFAQKALGSPDYLQQAPDPDDDPAHFLISALALLSSETIDNITVIQDQGSRYLRRQTLFGRPTDVFEYGAEGRNEYYVDVRTGTLRRVSLDLPKLGGTATLDFDQRGPKEIALPPKAERTTA